MNPNLNKRQKERERQERAAERRSREDAAPRLKDRAPDLVSLKLEVEESRDAVGTGEPKHVRHIVVERAPALFILPCGDRSCEGGGYDVTTAVLHALEGHEEHFTAADRCHGTVGNAACGRNLRVIGTATYRK